VRLVHYSIDPEDYNDEQLFGARYLPCGLVVYSSRKSWQRAWSEATGTAIGRYRMCGNDWMLYKDAYYLKPGDVTKDTNRVTCVVCLTMLAKESQ
jgi:hypothetical protein